MKNINLRVFGTCLLVFAMLGAGCQWRGSHKIMGGASVKQEQLMARLPNTAPKRVYVSDFQLDAQEFHADQGVRGALPGRLQQRFGSLGQGLPSPLATHDPAGKARQIVDEMSESLVNSLTEKGFAATRLNPGDSILPSQGWLVSGTFTEVDEGNRLKRAVIGFGQGATQMEVQVGISNLSSSDPKAPFVIFGTVEDPSKLPGAAVTMNPYVAAAKFVLEKNATERDVRHTADQIVAEILKFRDKVRKTASE